MSKTYIPRALRQQVIERSGGRCAYCHALISITGARFVIDHIIPEAAGGKTILENLCLACHSCNEFKGAQVQGNDPLSDRITALFHPIRQRWRDHFVWSQGDGEVLGITPIGRATIAILNMNHPDIVEARLRWASVGWHPPFDDMR